MLLRIKWVHDSPFENLYRKMPASEAEKKFWNCPELVENLLPHLDLKSLALLLKVLKAHQPIIDKLTEATVTWDNLTRRTVSGWDKKKDFRLYRTRSGCEEGDPDRWVLRRDPSQEKHIMDSILDLIKIMNLMKNGSNSLGLLDIICERFPADEVESEWQQVKVSCPNHGSHSVALFGYLVLEAIEGVLGTVQQAIRLVHISTIRQGHFRIGRARLIFWRLSSTACRVSFSWAWGLRPL